MFTALLVEETGYDMNYVFLICFTLRNRSV